MTPTSVAGEVTIVQDGQCLTQPDAPGGAVVFAPCVSGQVSELSQIFYAKLFSCGRYFNGYIVAETRVFDFGSCLRPEVAVPWTRF